VVGQLGGFIGDPLEDVVDKRVHDTHGLAGDKLSKSINRR